MRPRASLTLAWVPLVSSLLCVLEMVECMKRVAALDVELTVEERNLLSVAYKNVIGARRASWRIISSIEQKEESKSGDSAKLTLIKDYRSTVRCRCFCVWLIVVLLWYPKLKPRFFLNALVAET